MAQTLQYGVTRAQESEAVNTHMICEEISKIGFFCDSVASAHDPEKRKGVVAELAKPDPVPVRLLTDSSLPIECC